MNLIQIAQTDSVELLGPQCAESEPDQSSIQFMVSLRDLVLRKAKAEAEAAEYAANAAIGPTLPHRIYTPRLHFDGLEWVCQWGQEKETALCGYGKFPSEALLNFDLAWHGKNPVEP
jgi:hypothetical protein